MKNLKKNSRDALKQRWDVFNMNGVLEVLESLIKIDTSNATNTNVIVNELLNIFWYSKSHIKLYDGNKIVAVLFGVNCKLQDLSDTVIFSGHIDTVNSNAKRMMSIKDGKVYGLGSTDMKCFFACVDTCIKENKHLIEKFKPLIIAISFDEEEDNKGINSIIAYLKSHNIESTQCIVGEPTNLYVATRSRGCFDYELSVYSKNAHISTGLAQNPVEICVETGNYIKSLKTENTLINVCFFDCKKEFNVIHNICKMGFELRTYDFNEANRLIGNLHSFLGEKVIYKLEKLDNYMLPFENTKSELGRIITKLNDNNLQSFCASTEAGFFSSMGIDTIIFGPGDIRVAHSDDEYVLMDNLCKYMKIINEYMHYSYLRQKIE